MQRYEAIEDGIKRKDVRALREAIGTICYLSRDFSSGEFDEAVQYVESKGIKLKDDKLIGDPVISSQKSSFTDDDFASAVFELKENFCDERIRDVKTIGKSLYAKKTSSRAANQPANQRTNQGTLPKGQSHQANNMFIVIGLVAIIMILLLLLIRK